MKTKVIIVIVLFLLAIQFIKPTKNVDAKPQANNIEQKYPASAEVKAVLKTACYDCHSNNTTYPWYANIQPVAWWLDHHIEEGKQHLNFDEFLAYSLKKQDHKLEEVIESQTDKWMPLDSYTWINGDARLTDEQRKSLINWAEETRSKIQADSSFTTSAK